jgi:arylsulfatase A-like enzyme
MQLRPPTPLAAVAALVIGAALVWYLGFGSSPARLSSETPARCTGCNLLLIVLDAARADHFGCYGYSRPTTPNIDRLADESVLFERAVSNASFTMGSVASLLSGIPPAQHGVMNNKSALSQEATTLAEVLESRGYRTAAFTENPVIGPKYGYAQGFQQFHQFRLRRPDGEIDLSQSRENVAEMVRWMDAGESGAPFFLYAHFLRPHNPYHALPEHAGRFSQGYSGKLRGRTMEIVAANAGMLELSESDLQHLTDLYDENLLSADALAGDLVDALRERSLLESTIVVLVSDHGEGFQEHRWLSHGFQVYQEDVHVPVLIRFPKSLGIGPRRERTLVQLTDLMPTVLAALGANDGVKTSGWNLMPLLTGARGERRPRPIISHGAMGVSLRHGDLKLIRVTRGTRDRAHPLLFDLREDPGELRDLASIRGSEMARMRVRLDAVLRRRKERAMETPVAPPDPARLEQLRALGYAE